MRDLPIRFPYRIALVICVVLVTLPRCSNKDTSLIGIDEPPGRELTMAFIGELAVKILINGQPLTSSTLADRLRVDMVVDPGRPTFVGLEQRIILPNPGHTQAKKVAACPGPCEGNVFYDDLWGSVTSGSNRGTVADGDYTVKLFRDGSTPVGSVAIAVNHADYLSSNGTFLDEASDQNITFFLNQNLQQVKSPDVTNRHTRASIHLSTTITQPATSDTTVTVGQLLTVKGSGLNGLPGTTKKFAWDFNAKPFHIISVYDTEFTASSTATHAYTTPGDYLIRLAVRDGNDNGFVPPAGGHYAVSTTKMVHVVSP